MIIEIPTQESRVKNQDKRKMKRATLPTPVFGLLTK